MEYEASINGIAFDYQAQNDAIPVGLVKHGIHGAHRPTYEPTGVDEWTVKFTAVFLPEIYDNHRLLRRLVETELGPYELVHPVEGPLRGYIKNLGFRFDDSKETVYADISFAIDGEAPEPEVAVDIAVDAEDRFEAGIFAMQGLASGAVMSALGAAGAAVIDVELDENKGLLEQLADTSGVVREFVKIVDAKVTELEGLMTQIANPANSLIGTIKFATNLPGRVAGSISRAVERYVLAFETLKSAPDNFARQLKGAISSLELTLSLDEPDPATLSGKARAAAKAIVKRQLRVGGAQVVALEVSYALARDEDGRKRARGAVEAQAFDAAGNYLSPEPSAAVLDARCIDRAVAIARRYLQGAVNEAREVTSLKDQALALQKQAERVKAEGGMLVIVDVPVEIPLHVFCHQRGLSYRTASRVLALNPGMNPNFVKGEVFIYVS